MIQIKNPKAFKTGSTWKFLMRRKTSEGVPIDLTNTVIRSMFRTGSETGPVIATLTDGNGLTIDREAGEILLVVSPTHNASIKANVKVFFDVEITNPDTTVWQSSTYFFLTEAEITK